MATSKKIIQFPVAKIVPCANCNAEIHLPANIICADAVFIFCDEECEREFKANQGMTDWDNMAVG